MLEDLLENLKWVFTIKINIRLILKCVKNETYIYYRRLSCDKWQIKIKFNSSCYIHILIIKNSKRNWTIASVLKNVK